MSAMSVEVPYQVFTDRDGEPLENGYVWVGVANQNPQTNPIQVYFDRDLTQPAAQPLRTIAGYVSNSGTPAQIFVDASNYSILVQDKNGTMVYNFPDGTGLGATVPASNVLFTGFKNQIGVVQDLADNDGSDWIGYKNSAVNSIARSVEDKLRESVSVKDFGAVGDGVADDTAAIQAALNGQVRNIRIPAGNYKITNSLILQQGTMLFGDGDNDEIQSHKISKILSYGDFDALVVNPGAPGYFGYQTIKNINIVKASGLKTNSGLKAANFAPHIVLESVQIENFNIGFDMFTGLAQINSCNARFNNTGFEIRCTSSVFQNCYSNRNTTGYRFRAPSVYSSLIGCAADSNTGNAYEFIGTTGPFNSNSNSAANGVITMISCGSEQCGRYLYVDGNFSIEVTGPTVSGNTTPPYFAYIESAKRVYFKQIEGIPAFQWLFVNKTKNTPDVVVVEGDMAFRNLISPPTALFDQVPIATESLKTVIGVPSFGRTLIPSLQSLSAGGAGTGSSSFIYKSMFESQAPASNPIRLRVKVWGNGNANNALIKVSQFRVINGSADATADISLHAQNVGGIATIANSSSANFTFLQAQATAPDGFIYRYFYIRSSFSVSYLWDIQATTNFQGFNSDYSNWTVQQANATTTGGINSGSATLTVTDGSAITNGMQILVIGAGVAGADLLTTVSSGGGTNTLTLAANAATTVSGAAVAAYAI
jgi:hypothetical protein